MKQPLFGFSNFETDFKTNTAYWENFFSEDELQKIENLPAWKNTKKAVVFRESLMVDDEQRISDVNWLENTDENRFIYERIGSVIAAVNQQYFNFDLTGLYEEIQLGIYDSAEGGHYDWHMDVVPTGIPRKLSFSMLLSRPTDFEGGDLQIKNSTDVPNTLLQERGRAWIFPSVYLHRVTPVTKGIRKSLVVWAGGPAFR